MDAINVMQTIDEARTAKWQEGSIAHGDTFVKDPLIEVFEEHLDAINYYQSLAADSDRFNEDERAYFRMKAREQRAAAVAIRGFYALHQNDFEAKSATFV